VQVLLTGEEPDFVGFLGHGEERVVQSSAGAENLAPWWRIQTGNGAEHDVRCKLRVKLSRHVAQDTSGSD
jgi:hypothetical protein